MQTHSDDKAFLATDPLGSLLLRLALPTVAAQLINMLYNIVDRIYIGHIPETGALALTGVGVCLPLIMIVSAFAALVGNGGAPRATIAMGQGNKEKAEEILGNCFALQIVVSVLLTVILFLGDRTFLLAFGASANTIDYAVAYMDIYAVGTIFVQMTLGMSAFITAQGFAKEGMLSVLIGAVANIILDPVFIFGLNMGVRGAALATVLSQALSCAWVLAFLFGKRTFLRLRASTIHLSPTVLLPCVALGAATFIMQASESVISVAFNSSLLKYGGDMAVGAMTILSSVMQFAMLPLQGLGQGAQPIISYNYGAGKRDRVKKAYFLLLRVSVLYSCRAGCVYRQRAAHLCGGTVPLRHPDGLPDDLYLPGQGQAIHPGGRYAQVYPAAAADLHYAPTVPRRPGPRRLYGGAGGRHPGRTLYGDLVFLHLPQSAAPDGKGRLTVHSSIQRDRKVAAVVSTCTVS